MVQVEFQTGTEVLFVYFKGITRFLLANGSSAEVNRDLLLCVEEAEPEVGASWQLCSC